MKIGRRLAIKILNASKFALGRLGDGPVPGIDAVHEALDVALLAQLAKLIEGATVAHEAFDYAPGARADRGLLLVVLRRLRRAGQDARLRRGHTPHGADSARATLALALSALLRLFAPFLPFVTEEVWSWWQAGSVHRAPWPSGRGRAARRGGAGRARRGRRGARRRPREKTAQKRVHAGPGGHAHGVRPTRGASTAVEAARGDLDRRRRRRRPRHRWRTDDLRGSRWSWPTRPAPRSRGRPPARRRPCRPACPRGRRGRAA